MAIMGLVMSIQRFSLDNRIFDGLQSSLPLVP